MPKTECFWYIGESLLPWEAASAGALARALIRGGTAVKAFAASGVDGLNIPGILSWRSMTSAERASAALIRGRLWHLWGTPPPWWPLVRLRARTVHSSFLPHTDWKGHPTVMSAVGRTGRETYIPPALEVKVNWNADGAPRRDKVGDGPVCLFAGNEDRIADYSFTEREGSDFHFIGEDGREGMENLAEGRTVLIIENPTPSLALLAAAGALMGAPTAAPESLFMDEMLGPDGYIRLNPENLRESFALLTGEAGRGASASARRLASEQFAPEKGAKRLENLYRSLARKKDEKKNEG